MDLSYIQQQERLAMIGNKTAVIEVVSALRKYRELVSNVLQRTGLELEVYVLNEMAKIEENS